MHVLRWRYILVYYVYNYYILMYTVIVSHVQVKAKRSQGKISRCMMIPKNNSIHNQSS